MQTVTNWTGLKTFIHREIHRFLRVWIQSLINPWINATLYIVVFGFIVGSKIDQIAGVSYIDFVLPGILMLNIIRASFSQTSYSLYFQRFSRYIEEILVAPLSSVEMLLGYIAGGIARGFTVGLGVFVLAVLFSAANLAHFGWFVFYAIAVSIIFSLAGLIIGMWADDFEQLSMVNTFIVTPFTFLGGVFNSINMLPENMRLLVKFNPFFYFVDGLRYSMIGIQESDPYVGFLVIFVLILILSILVIHLFNIGWRVRE
ncbi:MAG: ABC transporter permease [Candidatus Magasanikbacteria bacterium]